VLLCKIKIKKAEKLAALISDQLHLGARAGGWGLSGKVKPTEIAA
jgi:hypothetical protein